MESKQPKTAVLVLTATVLLLSATFLDARSLHKRSPWSLKNFLNYYTHRSGYDYSDYGCFCGYNFDAYKGTEPVDAVDECCKRHDECYSVSQCHRWCTFTSTYNYECDDNTHTCQCLDTDGVSYAKCECDRIFAECVSQTTYNASFYNYDQYLCSSNEVIDDDVTNGLSSGGWALSNIIVP